MDSDLHLAGERPLRIAELLFLGCELSSRDGSKALSVAAGAKQAGEIFNGRI